MVEKVQALTTCQRLNDAIPNAYALHINQLLNDTTQSPGSVMMIWKSLIMGGWLV